MKQTKIPLTLKVTGGIDKNDIGVVQVRATGKYHERSLDFITHAKNLETAKLYFKRVVPEVLRAIDRDEERRYILSFKEAS